MHRSATRSYRGYAVAAAADDCVRLDERGKAYAAEWALQQTAGLLRLHLKAPAALWNLLQINGSFDRPQVTIPWDLEHSASAIGSTADQHVVISRMELQGANYPSMLIDDLELNFSITRTGTSGARRSTLKPKSGPQHSRRVSVFDHVPYHDNERRSCIRYKRMENKI